MLNILLVKTSSMGDLIHNMPVIADIRARHPDAVIDWVTEDSFAEIAALNPCIDQRIIVSMRRWKKQLFSTATWQAFFDFRQRLRQRPYDAILDTQGLLKSALICHWAHGPSHGANRHTAREAIAGRVYDHAHDIPKDLHAVTRNRLVAAKALGYSLDTLPLRYDLKVPDTALPFAISKHTVPVFHGTARAAKLWPVEHWIALGITMQQHGLQMLLPWGSEVERLRAVKIAEVVPTAIVPPRMSLSQLATLIQQAPLTIGLDTGLMHLAVALDIPTLAIFCDTHIWQAGALPAASGKAVTIGGKGITPSPDEAWQALQSLSAMPDRARSQAHHPSDRSSA